MCYVFSCCENVRITFESLYLLKIVSNTLVFHLMRVEFISRRKKTKPKLLPCLAVRPDQRGRIIYERRRVITQRSEISSGTSRLVFAFGCVYEEHLKDLVNLENIKNIKRKVSHQRAVRNHQV